MQTSHGNANTTSADPAWQEADLRKDPHAVSDKASRVRRMFASIAPKYDLNNRLHSFGRDQAWRRAAVQMAALRDTDRVVDIACGTGDVTIAMEDALWTHGDDVGSWSPSKGQVTGIDFTFEMLPLARRKDRQRRHGEESWIRWLNADAMRLPLPDACCDVVSIAFGIRNVAEPRKAIAEFYRVLRPEGRVIVLEFSQPTHPLIRAANSIYCGKIMPLTATWIAGDKSGAYKYLPRSVDTFLDRAAMVEILESVGFVEIVTKPLTFGVAVVYRGVKRGDGGGTR